MGDKSSAEKKWPGTRCIVTHNSIGIPHSFEASYDTSEKIALIDRVRYRALDQYSTISVNIVTQGRKITKTAACLFLSLAWNCRIAGKNHHESAAHLINEIYHAPGKSEVWADAFTIEAFVRWTQSKNALGIGINVAVFNRDTGGIDLFHDGDIRYDRMIFLEFNPQAEHYCPLVLSV